MAWMEEINIIEAGVALPTGGAWVPVPGSPFEIMTRGTDEFGVFRVRLKLGSAWCSSESCAGCTCP